MPFARGVVTYGFLRVSGYTRNIQVALSCDYSEEGKFELEAPSKMPDGEAIFSAKTKFEGLICQDTQYDFREYAPRDLSASTPPILEYLRHRSKIVRSDGILFSAPTRRFLSIAGLRLTQCGRGTALRTAPWLDL